MEITETFYAKNRKEWRAWLEDNFDKKKEIWLIYYKKHTGKPNVSYDESVEEALCFGWIDGILKRIDDERYVRRLTPRRMKSIWSAPNIKRARKMIDEKLMTEHGLTKIPDEVMKAIKSGDIISSRTIIPDEMPIMPELERELGKNKKASKTWDSFTPYQRKQYIYWIIDAKREDTKVRRIGKLMKMLEEGKRQLM